jgi:AcrR family transcriptional regulator
MSKSTSAELKKENLRDISAERTKQDIIQVATEEIATHGLTGARVDEIAKRTSTSKAMIYYYFGSKNGLYLAVMDNIYANIRKAEESAHIAPDAPASSMLRAYVENTFDYHAEYPLFARMISIENIHNASFLKQSIKIKDMNRPLLLTIKSILDRGIAEGTFRKDVKPLELHYVISALCIFRISNGQTFGAIFDVDLHSAPWRKRQRKLVVEAVLGVVAKRAD